MPWPTPTVPYQTQSTGHPQPRDNQRWSQQVCHPPPPPPHLPPSAAGPGAVEPWDPTCLAAPHHAPNPCPPDNHRHGGISRSFALGSGSGPFASVLPDGRPCDLQHSMCSLQSVPESKRGHVAQPSQHITPEQEVLISSPRGGKRNDTEVSAGLLSVTLGMSGFHFRGGGGGQ